MSEISDMIQRLCPDGVEYRKLGEVGDFENIGVDKKVVAGERSVTLLNYVDVYKHIYINNSIPKMIVTASDKKRDCCTCLKGDIFITPTSETPDDIGHASVITEDLVNTVYSYHIMRYRLYEYQLTTSYYIRYLFETSLVQNQIRKLAKGLTRFGLSKYDFAKIEIPVPPLEVQRKIVEVLDNFSELTAELEAELEARKKQYEYYRDNLLNFSQIAPPNSVNYVRIGDIAKFTYGYTDRAKMEGRYRFIRITDITEMGNLSTENAMYVDETEQTRNYCVGKGDLLMARTGATYGKTLYVPDDTPAVYASFLIKISLDNSIIMNRYYWHYAKSNYYWEQAKRYVSSGGQPQFNANALSQVLIPIPPLAEQERIVSILDRFEALTTDLTAGLPAEIKARQQQYEYYRDQLLTFKRAN